MTETEAEAAGNSTRRAWTLGVRARLLLAFFAIAAFSVLAAAAGNYAFREVGARLDAIDARIPPTLAALDLSRSAERIIAAAPALLAATDSDQRDEIKAELAAETGRLAARLAELNAGGVEALPPLRIEPIVSSLTANLAELEALVVRRVETSERLRALRGGVFLANDETQRLLAPWLAVTSGEIAMLIEARSPGPAGPGEESQRLASLTELQRLMRTAQAQVSAVADMLAEASTTDEPRRLPILAFQLGLALGELEAAAAGFDARLRPLFLEQVARLRQFVEGRNAVAEARRQELALVAQGEELLAEAAGLSAELTAAVDELGSAAKRDIGAAIRDALAVQRLSAGALVAVGVLSLATSVLIVWLYVGRSIVRRLTGLRDGMLAIAGGSLDTPIAVEGNDEIAEMGRAVEIFRKNTLERDGFAIASRYKSRFIASASHDLRQPLHALNLLVAQLRIESGPEERDRLIGRIKAAVGSMNELFDALLDMSKLEAGVLEAQVSEFPIESLLARMETTFAEAAREKGLRLAVVPCSAWVCSDFILLERILLNLVSNAVRYTERGGVAVGCRRRGDRLRLDVCDSGTGIPEERQRAIFGEFVQLAAAQRRERGGLGLGLSIVERLARLLDHPIELSSRRGKGSRFSVAVPLAADPGLKALQATTADRARGKLVVVIDDDALVLDGMGGILRGWGCEVIAAESDEAALAQLAAQRRKPDLIISDYRLAGSKTGIDTIGRIRGQMGATLPALLISGDTVPEVPRLARASGFHLLKKPVSPMRLRTMLNKLAAAHDASGPAAPAAQQPPIRRRAAARGPAPRP